MLYIEAFAYGETKLEDGNSKESMNISVLHDVWELTKHIDHLRK